jgi:hypothetical protein
MAGSWEQMLYKAFISYSHAADGKLAPALQRSLHNIAKPWYRLRSMRVFRDETNLSASPGLWSKIEQALNQADYFLFLASPTIFPHRSLPHHGSAVVRLP